MLLELFLLLFNHAPDLARQCINPLNSLSIILLTSGNWRTTRRHPTMARTDEVLDEVQFELYEVCLWNPTHHIF
jgi:hypothetical protein